MKQQKEGGFLIQQTTIDKYISIIKRWSGPYFDKSLAEYGIGYGQTFFLLHIAAHPDITLQELAWRGGYDKATATKAVKKLTELGYLTHSLNPSDRRAKHLKLTEQADQVLNQTKLILNQWVNLITDGLTMEEKQQVAALLQKMAVNAYTYGENNRRKENIIHESTN